MEKSKIWTQFWQRNRFFGRNFLKCFKWEEEEERSSQYFKKRIEWEIP